MERNLLYLDTYLLQQDMRIRLPKSIIENMKVKKGVSMFSIYYDSTLKELVLRIAEEKEVKDGSEN